MPKCVPQDPLLRVHGGSTLEAGDPGGALPSTPLLCDRPLTCESGAAGAGAATGAGLPAAANVSPAGLPGWLTPLPSLADASLLTGGCAPGCLCSAQRSSWLLTASLRFLLWVVLEIRVSRYMGQPLWWGAGARLCRGNPCRTASCRFPVPAPCPRSARPSCSSSSSSPPSGRLWAGPGLRADERGGRLARTTSGRLHLSGRVGRAGGQQLSSPLLPAASLGGPMSLSPQSVLQATPQQVLLSSPGKESGGAARPPSPQPSGAASRGRTWESRVTREPPELRPSLGGGPGGDGRVRWGCLHTPGPASRDRLHSSPAASGAV